MNSEIDIIYYTLFPWENAYSSVSLSFTREFCKNNRVFYINKPWSWRDFWENRDTNLAKARKANLMKGVLNYEEIAELPENVVAVQPPLTTPINFLPDGALYRKLAAKNHQVVVETVEQVIKDFNVKNYIYLNCYNPYHGALMPKELNPLLNIYQCIDDMKEENYTARHGNRLENEVCQAADIVTFTGTELLTLKGKYNPNSHIVHKAADFSIFKKAIEKKYRKPTDIAHIETKIIGFTGNMDSNRIDYNLLGKVAERHADKTLVLVGPINSNEFSEKGLDKIKNIVWVGPKHIRELPIYLQHFDCVLIPFLKNKLTASIYPLKINEYLAAGKSVVSTNFSVDIAGFSDVIYLAENEDLFLNMIEKAVNDNAQKQIDIRVAKAKESTWTARVNQFWDIINPHLEKKMGS